MLIPLSIPAQPDTQTSFAEINPGVLQVSNGGRQWSYNFRQYRLSGPLYPGSDGAGQCHDRCHHLLACSALREILAITRAR
jgi:hypothetical protein